MRIEILSEKDIEQIKALTVPGGAAKVVEIANRAALAALRQLLEALDKRAPRTPQI